MGQGENLKGQKNPRDKKKTISLFQERLRFVIKDYISRSLEESKRVPILHDQITRWSEMSNALSSIKAINLNDTTTRHGNVYKADIPENDTLIDWGAALEHQPQQVKKGIKKIIAKFSSSSPTIADKLMKSRDGAEFYHNLEQAVKPLVSRGKIKSGKHGTITRADMAASLLLNQVGIFGNRFFDEGEQNFVIWNTDMIKLLGLTQDSDENAKQYFREQKAKSLDNSESYKQSADTIDKSTYDFTLMDIDGNPVSASDKVLAYISNELDFCMSETPWVFHNPESFDPRKGLTEEVKERKKNEERLLKKMVKEMDRPQAIAKTSERIKFYEDVLKAINDTDTVADRNGNSYIFYDRDWGSTERKRKRKPTQYIAVGDIMLTPKAKAQYDAIVEKYKGTDKWLKAPNGKDTNLSEKQWVLVRIPNFKKWFGDWENNPAQSSKILDENGEPLVVYHGTPNGGFSKFNTKGKDKTEGTGAWFHKDKNAAKFYSLGSSKKQVYAVFLNIRNPYILDAQGRIWDELGSLNNGKYPTTDDIVRAVWNGNLGNSNHDGIVFRNIKDNFFEDGTVSDTFCVPEQRNIKSATNNNGNYGKSSDIYKQTANSERNNAQQVEANNLEWALRIFRQQLETVRRLYQGTDKWMKAPNGQPTNLTEKQWLQVRTPNFKRWFGDWEKHPENASKVVDRNGEPLIVYRGTPKGDTINQDGSRSRVFNTEGFNGSGSFYSSNINFANSYAGLDNIKTGKSHVYSVFLNLRNPFIVDARNNGWTEIPFDGKNYTTNELAQKVRSGKIGDDVIYDGVIVKNVSDWGVEEAGITDTNILVSGEQLVIKARDGLIYEEGYREEDITPEDIDRYINENPNISNRAKRMYKQYLKQNFADDFIVFNRNAIKSATGNNGAFGTETGDIYKQIIGIDGARRLDEAEGTHTHMDNLRLAKSMERNGSTTAKIWAATGWKRGADNKWRYEIPDGKINRKKLEQLRKIANEFQALNDFYDNSPNHNDTQEEIDHYNALENSYYAKLSDVFDAPELFTAYPDLRDIGVWIDNNLNAAAEYDSLTNSIIISGYNTNFSEKRELRKSIIHEIQHAVQVREGFALGSTYDNTDTLYKRYVNKVHSLWDKLGEKLQRKVREIVNIPPL